MDPYSTDTQWGREGGVGLSSLIDIDIDIEEMRLNIHVIPVLYCMHLQCTVH